MRNTIYLIMTFVLLMSCKETTESKFEKDGISLTCPSGWKIIDEENLDNQGYYLSIEKDGLIEVKTWQDDSQIAISIKDNGPGVAMAYQGRVFDPFFTTKETGKGTGLGLSISFSIIEKMGGMITLDSEPSKGAAFTVKLPVVIPGKK